MKVAKNGIRVIKREEREEREHQAQRPTETPEQGVGAALDANEVKERELVSSVTQWVNDLIRQRHAGFTEDASGQLAPVSDS